MRSRPRSIATVALALAVCVVPGSAAPAAATPARAAPRATPAAHGAPAAASAIVPGSVDRTSLALRAAYDVELKLNYTRRTLSAVSTMLVTNVSGGPVDRLELNAVAARLGRLAISEPDRGRRRGQPDDLRPDDPSCRSAGSSRRGSTSVRIAFRATARKTLTASNWLFTRTNGDPRSLSLAALDQPRRTPFDRRTTATRS